MMRLLLLCMVSLFFCGSMQAQTALSKSSIDERVSEIKSNLVRYTMTTRKFPPDSNVVQKIFRDGKRATYVLTTSLQFEWRIDTLEYIFLDGYLTFVNDKRINSKTGVLEVHDRIYLDKKEILSWIDKDGVEVTKDNCIQLNLEEEFGQLKDQYLEISKSWR